MGKQLQKILSALLLILAIAVTQIPASDAAAQTAASDFQITNQTLVKYSGTTQDVVQIPSGVKVIGEGAFEHHNELVKVVIGEQVEEIAYNAFADCNSLRTVTIGDTVKKIDTAAFHNCINLTNVSIGKSVKSLGISVFAGCENLSKVDLSGENTYLAYQSGIIYNNDMTHIYQLLPGYKLEKYVMPNSVSSINAYAFWGNPHLVALQLGGNLTEIPDYAFSNCIGLNEVSVPYSVRRIGVKAFEDCVNLKKMNLPESVNSIHDTAFDGCGKVDFATVEGSYGDTFVKTLSLTEVDEAEYEDVEEAVIVSDTAMESSKANEEDKSPAPSEDPLQSTSPEVVTEYVEPENLLGSSYIVSGKALVFIDNAGTQVYEGNSSLTQEPSESSQPSDESGVLQNLLNHTDGKGGGFPKYTIVDQRIIANQAHYQDAGLISYEFPSGIKEIGDFAFSRSSLSEIKIPDGVETIGYAAFYHCNQLMQVEIPDSVTDIGPWAFDQTPWVNNWKNQVGSDFLIVGDGILIAYSGSDGIVNIPDGTKQIAAGVFRDHMGITAVYLPQSLEVIGEEAFSGCKNLKTINGAQGVKRIKDRAFYECALSELSILEGVEEIGVMAFALSEDGTDTVVFRGGTLPEITQEKTTTRLSNEDYRGLVFAGIEKAVILNSGINISGTVLDEFRYGFRGTIATVEGAVIADTTGAGDLEEAPGILVRINSESLSDDNTSATMPGNSGSFVLKITDSDTAKSIITKAYAQIYGNREPAGLLAYDISLIEQPSGIQITKLGKQYVTVMLPMPSLLGVENLHVVCTDENGQLEEVDYQIVQLEDGDYIQFNAKHFSPYGFYQYSDGFDKTAAVVDGSAEFLTLSGAKDNTPDTGDGPHPKWFLAFGLLCASVAVFFYKRKPIVMN